MTTNLNSGSVDPDPESDPNLPPTPLLDLELATVEETPTPYSTPPSSERIIIPDQNTSSSSLPQVKKPALTRVLLEEMKHRRNDDLDMKCLPKLKYATEQSQIMPYPWEIYSKSWEQIKIEILAGLAVAFAQVSESIAFSYIAGVPPLLGLHAAWIMGLITSVFGSRSGMINGATGVRAAVIAPYILKYGIGITFYIILSVSIFQAAAGFMKLSKFINVVPRPAMIGFVNGLAIILALGQIPQFRLPGSTEYLPWDVIGWMIFIVVLSVPASIYFKKVPKIGKAIPPSLVGIIVSVILEFGLIRPLGFKTPTVGDTGKVNGNLPIPFFLDPQYQGVIPPLSWEIISICIVPGFIAAAAGMVETVMTMEVINDLTDTTNESPDQQLFALATGNFIAGIMGSMGGGATIGLSMINIDNGSNGYFRLSGISAAIFLFSLVIFASPVISIIPTASLVGVMVIVCFNTFEWESLMNVTLPFIPKQLREKHHWFAKRKMTRNDAIVIILVTIITLLIDLFTAVLCGVMYSAISFSWKSYSQFTITSNTLTEVDGSETKTIHVNGPLFFASAMKFERLVKPSPQDPDNVEIHFLESQIYDFTGIHVLNSISEKYNRLGKSVHLRHLCEPSMQLLTKADSLTQHFSYQTSEVLGEEVDIQAPHHFHVERK